MVHAALLLLMLEAVTTRTSLNHQPEAQHPKSSAIHKLAGRLPHLSGRSGHPRSRQMSRLTQSGLDRSSRLTDGTDAGARRPANTARREKVHVPTQPVRMAAFDPIQNLES